MINKKERYQDELYHRLSADPDRSKLPSTNPGIAQIRWAGKTPYKGMVKFIFQHGPGIEGNFLLSEKFTQQFEGGKVDIGYKKIRSWHSNQKYTPIMFWNLEDSMNGIILALYMGGKLRAYKLPMTCPHPDKQTNGLCRKPRSEG